MIIGDVVLVYGTDLGIVVKPEHNNCKSGVWVFVYSKGYASCYDECNVKLKVHNDERT